MLVLKHTIYYFVFIITLNTALLFIYNNNNMLCVVNNITANIVAELGKNDPAKHR